MNAIALFIIAAGLVLLVVGIIIRFNNTPRNEILIKWGIILSVPTTFVLCLYYGFVPPEVIVSYRDYTYYEEAEVKTKGEACSVTLRKEYIGMLEGDNHETVFKFRNNCNNLTQLDMDRIRSAINSIKGT